MGKVKYICCICNENFEVGNGFVTLNLHSYGPLVLNKKGNGFLGPYMKAACHKSCMEDLNIDSTEERCSCCHDLISSDFSNISSKLVLYEYKKKGWSSIMSFHDDCLKKICHESFAIIKI